MTLCTGPVWAGIYMGTDATPPQTYQSNANYPQNIVVSGNTAAERNCRLYYDGKGPIPPLTCSGATPPMPSTSTPVAKTPAPGMSTVSTAPISKNSAPGMANTVPVVSPTTNDNAAQQAPLASAAPPLVRPVSVTKPVEAPKPQFVTTAMPGSLKENVERIVAQSHWGTVVWTLPVDYNWKGSMTITAPDVQGALSQLLKEYPVRAVFYDKNRIVAIESRRVI